MQNLLVVLFTLYPTAFIYNAIPDAHLAKLESLAPSGFLFFLSHLFVFGVIFFIVFTAMRKFIAIGYMSSGKRSFLGVAFLAVLLAAIIAIVFYTILPGESVYASPAFINKYILAEPWTIIILILPFGYLFFD